jgi:hypothetical protein
VCCGSDAVQDLAAPALVLDGADLTAMTQPAQPADLAEQVDERRVMPRQRELGTVEVEIIGAAFGDLVTVESDENAPFTVARFRRLHRHKCFPSQRCHDAWSRPTLWCRPCPWLDARWGANLADRPSLPLAGTAKSAGTPVI